MANIILVIDMLKGFLEEGNPMYCSPGARAIIPAVKKLLETEAQKGTEIFFICDTRNVPEKEGTLQYEIIPELVGIDGEVIRKTGFSGLYGNDLAQRLEKIKPQKILIAGVRTDVSVLHTACDLRNHNYAVEIPAECVASSDVMAHRAALEHMEKILGVAVTRAAATTDRHPVFELGARVLSGETADVYFARTMEILLKENINPLVAADIFCARSGIFCGIEEVKALLKRVLPAGKAEVWALSEGEKIGEKEVCVRIRAPYRSFGLYETAILGILSSSSAWATAAHECVMAAGGIPVISFGARHIHPNSVAVMDYAAIIGGCAGCSSIEGARLAGLEPSGTMPHALILIMGDTVKAALAFDRHISPEVVRVTLVDTFKDEVEESLRVARVLGDKLAMVRLDTPTERGRVTADLVKEVKAWLELKGFARIGIFVSGGLSPERITYFVNSGAPVAGFGVGHYISGAEPNDFKLDIHEIDGEKVAKRGRLPGPALTTRLKRII